MHEIDRPRGLTRSDVAPTPPMGWNSWDSYGLSITEAEFRANVEALRDRLKVFGWQYAVIDEGWFFENPEDRQTPERLRYSIDAYGRYVPVPERFPSVGEGKADPPPSHPSQQVRWPGTPASAKDDKGVSGAKDDRRMGGHGDAGFALAATVRETSFAALGEWVHAQGLKFGIHVVRGIPRATVERNLPIKVAGETRASGFRAQDAADRGDACPWDPANWGVKDNAAGQAWYDSLLEQYAGWGVDFLKLDCVADRPYKASEIRQVRRAMDKAGRPMVLSLSPGPTKIENAGTLGELGDMWRISDDIWDGWTTPASGFPQGVESQFARFAAWHRYAKPNNWPDGDMLAFGRLEPAPGIGTARVSGLSYEEQRTQMTLWAIARSPLMLGANVTLLDDATLGLLTNRDVIRINQTAVLSAEVLREGDLIAWRADLPDGEKALALFNVGERTMKVTRRLAEFGGDLEDRAWSVRDVWRGGDATSRSEVVEEIPPHGCALLMIE